MNWQSTPQPSNATTQAHVVGDTWCSAGHFGWSRNCQGLHQGAATEGRLLSDMGGCSHMQHPHHGMRCAWLVCDPPSDISAQSFGVDGDLCWFGCFGIGSSICWMASSCPEWHQREVHRASDQVWEDTSCDRWHSRHENRVSPSPCTFNLRHDSIWLFLPNIQHSRWSKAWTWPTIRQSSSRIVCITFAALHKEIIICEYVTGAATSKHVLACLDYHMQMTHWWIEFDKPRAMFVGLCKPT